MNQPADKTLHPAWNTVGLVWNVAQDLRKLSSAAKTIGLDMLSDKLWHNAELLETAGEQTRVALTALANEQAEQADKAALAVADQQDGNS